MKGDVWCHGADDVDVRARRRCCGSIRHNGPVVTQDIPGQVRADSALTCHIDWLTGPNPDPCSPIPIQCMNVVLIK